MSKRTNSTSLLKGIRSFETELVVRFVSLAAAIPYSSTVGTYLFRRMSGVS